MGIKLKKGDCVDTIGLNEKQRIQIIDYFFDCGCPCTWTHNPYEVLSSRYIYWDEDDDYINAVGSYDCISEYTTFNGANLLVELRSQDDTSDDLTTEELLEKHAEIRKSAETVISVNRNVVFTDYETNHLPGSMEITITDGEEVTVCVDKLIAFDNVDSKKNIEETVDILKVWRSIIDSAIKEMEE